jgi:hypothetical protein
MPLVGMGMIVWSPIVFGYWVWMVGLSVAARVFTGISDLSQMGLLSLASRAARLGYCSSYYERRLHAKGRLEGNPNYPLDAIQTNL